MNKSSKIIFLTLITRGVYISQYLCTFNCSLISPKGCKTYFDLAQITGCPPWNNFSHCMYAGFGLALSVHWPLTIEAGFMSAQSNRVPFTSKANVLNTTPQSHCSIHIYVITYKDTVTNRIRRSLKTETLPKMIVEMHICAGERVNWHLALWVLAGPDSPFLNKRHLIGFCCTWSFQSKTKCHVKLIVGHVRRRVTRYYLMVLFAHEL